jgi:hypothetical protein
LTACSNVCVNTATDLNNCGGCATMCPTGQVCTMGKCAVSCTAGLMNCTGSCVNAMSDASHCGDCGTVCATGQVCTSGKCAYPWTPRTSNSTANLTSVWGSGANDIYAVGDTGTILHSTAGMAGTAKTSNTTVQLWDLGGSGAGDVYAVGDQGTILHCTDRGTTWTPQVSGTAVFSPLNRRPFLRW